MSDGPKNDESIINLASKQLVVPVSVFLVAVTVLFAAQGWLDSRFKGLEHSLGEVAEELRGQQNRISRLEEGVGDRWSYTHMRLWALEFKNANPSLEVPTPEK